MVVDTLNQVSFQGIRPFCLVPLTRCLRGTSRSCRVSPSYLSACEASNLQSDTMPSHAWYCGCLRAVATDVLSRYQKSAD